MSWADLAGAGVVRQPSPSESARFGVDLARVTVGAGADPATRASAMAQTLDDTDADVVVVRYPAQAGDCAAAVASAGRDVLPAGALVYWATVPPGRQEPEPHPDLAVVAGDHVGVRASLTEVVTGVVESSFAGYANHYTFNPLLDDSQALAGYVEWAQRATLSGSRGATGTPHVGTLVLMHGEEAVGVATTSTGPEQDGGHHVEVLLAGITPSWQGRGWYQVLLSDVAKRAFATGASRLIISTQVHNTRVQRAWARQGLHPFAAVETVHAVRRGLLPTRR